MLLHLLTLLCALSTIFARPNGESAPQIVGGHEAQPGEIPYQAAVWFTTPRGTALCGGVIVAANWILTAAHCTVEATEYTIQVGSVLLEGDDPNRVTLKSSEVVVHPKFTLVPLAYDLALIKLDVSLNFNDYVNKIQLDTDGHYLDEIRANVSGWGLTSDLTATRSNVLKRSLMNTVNYLICGLETRLGEGDNYNICIEPRNSADGLGPCEGDSGGPVVYENTLLGIVSYYSVYGCNSLDEHPTAVRVAYFEEWIRGIIAS